MKPEPLKGKREEFCLDCDKGYIFGYKEKYIKSAVIFREQEFRERIAVRTLEGLNNEGKEPITIMEIMDISREVNKIAFKDVVEK